MTRVPNARALFARAALAALLTVGVAACGDTDDDAEDETDQATDDGGATDESAADEAGCSALVDFNTAASSQSENEDPTPDEMEALADELQPLWADVADVVPESSQEDAAVITDALADLKAGDSTAFDADATFATYQSVLAETVEACDFPTAAVTATESDGTYAFEGLSDTLDADTYALTMSNEGAEDHVIIFFRKNDGETRTAEELLALGEDEGSKAGTEAGSVYAPPGGEGSSLAELTPGNYVYFCPIPIGESGPPHFTEGMYGELTIS